MINLKSILASLSGEKPAAEKPSEAIRRLTAMAEQMRRELDVSRSELAAIAVRREALLVADDDTALDDDDRRAVVLHRNLERVEFALARIAEQIEQARADHRASRMTSLRTERDAIVHRLIEAMEAAVLANREAEAWHGRVAGELGAHAVNIEFGGSIAYPFFAREFIAPFMAHLEQMNGAAASLRRHSEVSAEKPAQVEPVTISVPEQRRRRPVRVQLTEAPPKGHRRALVLRAGYENPATGASLRPGDLVDLPEEVAEIAARNGAIEIKEGAI